ncbi:MAG: hypothetical protein ACOCTU_05705 [Bacteroidota bacterium]
MSDFKNKQYDFIFRNLAYSLLFAIIFSAVWEAVSYIMDNTFSIFHQTIPFLGLLFVLFIIRFVTKKSHKKE